MFHSENDNFIFTENVQDLKNRMETSHNIANRNLDAAKLKQKTTYDKKAKTAALEIRDKVLVKLLSFSGLHKLFDKYEQSVYEIVEQPNQDIAVYIVRDQDERKWTPSEKVEQEPTELEIKACELEDEAQS